MDYVENRPTWRHYDPAGSGSWSSPGATGSGDAVFIGSLTLSANVGNSLSGSNLAAALQAMVDGTPQNFLARRSDSGDETIAIDGHLLIDFDLDSPPT